MNTEQLVRKFHTKLIYSGTKEMAEKAKHQLGGLESESLNPQKPHKKLGGHRGPASHPGMQKAEISCPWSKLASLTPQNRAPCSTRGPASKQHGK